MSFLLVSDLDGTLLNSAKSLSGRTTSVLNDFISRGGQFTIATARMAYGCAQMLNFDLRLPGVVMNGAAIYSFADRRYVDTQPIAAAGVTALATAVAEVGAGAFIYAVKNGEIGVGCVSEADLVWEQYNSARAIETVGKIEILGNQDWERLGEVVYCAVVGEHPKLLQVTELLQGVPELSAHPYLNVYTGNQCLEFLQR